MVFGSILIFYIFMNAISNKYWTQYKSEFTYFIKICDNFSHNISHVYIMFLSSLVNQIVVCAQIDIYNTFVLIYICFRIC